MKEYLLLFRNCHDSTASDSPEGAASQMQKWAEWMGGLAQQGKLIGAQPLAETGKKVAGLKKVVTDGPFMEGKEMVGGYLICRASSYDEAVEIARYCPVLDFEAGTVEVREIQEIKM